MTNKDLLESINTAPESAGCYLYSDKTGGIIYIGKAKNLKRRVKQYFVSSSRLSTKTQALVGHITNIKFIQTDSEIDALVLEANLIKKYMPKYNRLMKDDKQYIWVKIDKSRDYPTISLTRDKKNMYKSDYYGPFPNKYITVKILKELRHIFPYCSRPINRDTTIKDTLKPCFYYHINLCNGACMGRVNKAQYRDNINKIASILRGNSKRIIHQLNTEMIERSKDKQYEIAAQIRDKIVNYKYMRQQHYIEFGMDETNLFELKNISRNKGLSRLIKQISIPGLTLTDNFKVECYDISNIQGKNAVGSMVVFVAGKKSSELYRKFKIKRKHTPDDFAMMKEVLYRRLHRLQSSDISFSTLPDLIIIDGGKGQLSSAFDVLQDLGLDIPIIGLAKREEEIVTLNIDNASKIFKLKKLRDASDELFLIQRIRDEAHRFAINFHRSLRSKQQVKSKLDTIKGIGPKTKRRLLKEFGSWSGIQGAKETELAEILHNKTRLKSLLQSKAE